MNSICYYTLVFDFGQCPIDNFFGNYYAVLSLLLSICCRQFRGHIKTPANRYKIPINLICPGFTATKKSTYLSTCLLGVDDAVVNEKDNCRHGQNYADHHRNETGLVRGDVRRDFGHYLLFYQNFFLPLMVANSCSNCCCCLFSLVGMSTVMVTM